MSYELSKKIQLLCDIGQSSFGNLLEFLVDLLNISLEFLYIQKDILTFLSASEDEMLRLGTPIVSSDTRLDSSVQDIKMLFEKGFFLIIDGVNNVVVIPNDKHNIFSGYSQLISLLEKSRDVMGDSYETKGLNLGPI